MAPTQATPIVAKTKPGYKSTEVNKVVEPFVDEFNLLLIDRDPNDASAKADKLPSNEALLQRARDNTQYLFNKIWQLKRKIIKDAVCAELPAKELYRLPREKPIPPPKEATKWERFAKEKGIKKQPKSKKVYDESTETWKPAFGYRRGNDDTKDWMIEIPRQKDPYRDYFGERIEDKKERTKRNEYQQMKNQMHAIKSNHRGGGDNVNDIPLGVGGRADFSNKKELTEKIHKAKLSTASAGKFQPDIKGELKPKLGVKRKFEPNEHSIKDEKDRQLNILKNLSTKKPKLDENRFGAAEHAISKASAAEENNDDGDGDGKFAAKGKGKRNDMGKKRPMGARGKSNVHRQQHYQKALKSGKPGKRDGGAKRGKPGKR
uniref:Ribosome biogenesis regulatory protein n=1 Tax=Panagrolaimus sp. PS1159 TaxID=55785 RepID=A0AC35G6N1_9BILA